MPSRDLIERVRKALGDRYTVITAVGRGGNASIFGAYDQAGQRVAIKVLHPELAVSVAADRFLREIRYASQLNHPHIARLLDSGETDYLLWFAMPYLPGEVRHREPQEVVGLARIQQARDVWMVELRGVADLAQEPVGGHRHRQLRMEHLDRHPLTGLVVGAEDGRVAAPPDRGDHGVAVTQRLAHPLDQVAARHGSLPVLPAGRGRSARGAPWRNST